MEYQILVKNDAESLEREVRLFIAGGWKPLGGVSTSHYLMRGQYSDQPTDTYWEYCQAMVKEGA